MKKQLQYIGLIMLSAIFFSSCYWYDGPTRIMTKQERKALPPVEKMIAKPLSKAEYLDKAFQEIKGTLADAEVTMIEDSIKVLFPNNIVYQNSATFPSSDYHQPLAKFSELLKKFKKTNILITGHTDNKGDETTNKLLSNTRASNIKNIINQEGIAMSRLTSWGLGSSSPIADNETEEGREKNRRVEFVVLYDE